MGFQDYLTSLADNPYFGAGAGLFGVGVVTQAARKGSVILSSLLKRKYVLTMEVPRCGAGFELYGCFVGKGRGGDPLLFPS